MTGIIPGDDPHRERAQAEKLSGYPGEKPPASLNRKGI